MLFCRERRTDQSNWYAKFNDNIKETNDAIDENNATSVCYWLAEARKNQLKYNICCFQLRCISCGEIVYIYIPRKDQDKANTVLCSTCRIKRDDKTKDYLTFDRVKLAYDIMTKYSETKYKSDEFLSTCKDMMINYTSGTTVHYMVTQEKYQLLAEICNGFNLYDEENESYEADPFHWVDHYSIDDTTGELIKHETRINLNAIESID